MTIERCWAYAMQLKEESIEDPRKKFSMRNKLRKAAKYTIEFEKLAEVYISFLMNEETAKHFYCLP